MYARRLRRSRSRGRLKRGESTGHARRRSAQQLDVDAVSTQVEGANLLQRSSSQVARIDSLLLGVGRAPLIWPLRRWHGDRYGTAHAAGPDSSPAPWTLPTTASMSSVARRDCTRHDQMADARLDAPSPGTSRRFEEVTRSPRNSRTRTDRRRGNIVTLWPPRPSGLEPRCLLFSTNASGILTVRHGERRYHGHDRLPREIASQSLRVAVP